MPIDQFNISEAELDIMKILWQSDQAATAQDVLGQLQHKDWKYSTLATLFSRMVEKGSVTYEKRGRFFYYTPAITEEDYKASQAKSFLHKLYNGSVKNLVASLVEAQELSQQDLDELKQFIQPK